MVGLDPRVAGQDIAPGPYSYPGGRLLLPDSRSSRVAKRGVLPAAIQLNAREQAILAGLFAGQTEAQVADALGISLRTVRRAITEQLLPTFQAHNLRELLVLPFGAGRPVRGSA
jgi:DNA-binding NarL/FixJ family response regulator